jgi:hypothetical protein
MQTTTTPRNELPAARYQVGVDSERLSPENPPKVGDLVAIHSRGSYRVARVTKVTKTRIETEYTTEGAIKESGRIFEMYADPSLPARMAKQEAAQQAKNFDYYAEVLAAGRSHPHFAHQSDAAISARLADYRAWTEQGKEAFVARHVEEVRESYEEGHAEALRRGRLGYLTVTRKTVSLTDSGHGVYRVA